MNLDLLHQRIIIFLLSKQIYLNHEAMEILTNGSLRYIGLLSLT